MPAASIRRAACLTRFIRSPPDSGPALPCLYPCGGKPTVRTCPALPTRAASARRTARRTRARSLFSPRGTLPGEGEDCSPSDLATRTALRAACPRLAWPPPGRARHGPARRAGTRHRRAEAVPAPRPRPPGRRADPVVSAAPTGGAPLARRADGGGPQRRPMPVRFRDSGPRSAAAPGRNPAGTAGRRAPGRHARSGSARTRGPAAGPSRPLPAR